MKTQLKKWKSTEQGRILKADFSAEGMLTYPEHEADKESLLNRPVLCNNTAGSTSWRASFDKISGSSSLIDQHLG